MILKHYSINLYWRKVLMYEPLKDTKKLIEKLKKVCTAMSKYNLNSPCLLQMIRINGTYEFILSHNPKNGDNFDYYKIFSTVTFDEFYISEEDQKLFVDNDERVSIPIVVSSCDLLEIKSLMSHNDIMKTFLTKTYDKMLNSKSEDSIFKVYRRTKTWLEQHYFIANYCKKCFVFLPKSCTFAPAIEG